jgi:hypothetical protein
MDELLEWHNHQDPHQAFYLDWDPFEYQHKESRSGKFTEIHMFQHP